MSSFAKLEAVGSVDTWKAARVIAREADIRRAYLDADHEKALREDRLRTLAQRSGKR